MSYEVIYNSDVVLADGDDLSAYCIFYDRVLLPYTSPETVSQNLEFTRAKTISGFPKLTAFELENLGYQTGTTSPTAGQDILDWEVANKALFYEGVLSRLPAPAQDFTELFAIGLDLPPSLHSLLKRSGAELVARDDTSSQVFYFRQDHVAHLLRTDLFLPQVFLTASKQPSREILKAAQAREVFAYLLPKTGLLKPEQILEVREKVKDTREGFSLHLQKLTKEVEAKLKGGESLDDIAASAQAVIETQLIPDYREFVRQLTAEKAGFWSGVLKTGDKILQIDAAPWTPKFYGDLMKAFGFSVLDTVADKKRDLSNVNQAYQFMYSIEKDLVIPRR